MVRFRLTNAKLPKKEYDEATARGAARIALADWYGQCYRRADKTTPHLQRDANLEAVKSIPGWLEKKGIRNGYIMVCTLLNATPKPLILELDYGTHASGGITLRQLHQQVRNKLELEPKVSLRMTPFRPWHRHLTKNFPIPEECALGARDVQCTHLLGTTILYYTYVHLRE